VFPCSTILLQKCDDYLNFASCLAIFDAWKTNTVEQEEDENKKDTTLEF
jgi:hypothetical protein